MRILVNGCMGRMGQTVCRMLEEGRGGHTLAAGTDFACRPGQRENFYPALTDYDGPADCVLDFSHHAATAQLLAFCQARRLPAVIATTGQTEAEKALIYKAATLLPIFFSANLSVGVALLASLARQTATLFPQADIEIVETHHNKKLDVPSGTALMLFDAVRKARPQAEAVIGRHENGKRGAREIGIHSLRLGNETGTHEVIVSTGSQTITLTHRAESRDLFAEGALSAAAFLEGKGPGLYTVNDLIGG